MSSIYSKQYVCMCHECGNDIVQYVSQSVLHVKVKRSNEDILSLLADTVIRHLTTLCSCWWCFVFVLTFAKDLKQISRIQLKPGKLWWSICFYCYFYFGVSSSFQHFQQHISPLRHQSRIILEGWSHCRRSFDINRDWKSTVCLESLRKKWTQLNVYTVFWFTFSLDIL